MKTKYLFTLSILLSFFLALTISIDKVAAASLNFSWSSQFRSQVDVSGGQLNSGQSITFNDPVGTKSVKSLQATVKTTSGFWPFISTNDTACKVTFTYETKSANTLYLTKGNTTGTPSAGGTTPECSTFNEDTTTALFDNVTVSISGTRLSDNASQELPSEKLVGFAIYAGTKTDVPNTITLKLTGAASSSDTLTKMTYNTGSKDYYWYSTEKSLEPGSYRACVTGFAVDCVNFTKEKFKSIGGTLADGGYFGVTLGSRVESESSKSIAIKLNIKTSTICQTQTIGPFNFKLQDSTGKVINSADSDSRTIDPTQNEVCGGTGASGTTTYSFNATMANVEPGNYKVCLGTNCQSVTKKDNVQAKVTFDISGTEATNLIQSSGSSGSTTCGVPSIGWILCPVINFLTAVSDKAYSFIEQNFLVLPAQETFNVGGPTYQAWTIVLGFANAGLILAFLVIIFSQVTGLGVSNYGIKKMLPRLIISALLINLSYFVAQIAVDLANILGKGIYDTFASIPLPQSAKDATDWSTGNKFSQIAVGILAAGTAAGAAYTIGLAALVPVVIAVVLAILMVFLILIVRQALVVLLVVIAPLAFLAFLLPNTSSLFTRWRKLLVALLLLYPIIALVMGASKFASGVLSSVYTDSIVGSVVAVAVQIIPLFAVPYLLSKSLAAIPVVGNYAKKLQGRATGRVGSTAKTAYQGSDYARARAIRKAELEKRRKVQFASRVPGRFSGIPAKLGAGVAGSKALGRTAESAVEAADAEDLKNARAMIDRLTDQSGRPLDNAALESIVATGSHNGRKFDEYGRRAAAAKLVQQGSVEELERLAVNGASYSQPIRNTISKTFAERTDVKYLSDQNFTNALSQNQTDSTTVSSALRQAKIDTAGSMKPADLAASRPEAIEQMRLAAAGTASENPFRDARQHLLTHADTADLRKNIAPGSKLYQELTKY